jgi:circadian clock protein KaiB
VTAPESRIRLCLFVSGRSSRSETAVSNLRRLLQGLPAQDYELEVVDVRSDPARAEAERVLVTPTLVKVGPTPSRRVVGDLSDGAQVARALDLGEGAVDRGSGELEIGG